LSFGSVTENTTSTEPVTLTSSGTAPLIINAASVIGTGFSLAGVSFPLTLNPSQSATLNVQFDPTALGNMTGIVSLTSNATSGATTSILLSGTGVAQNYQVDLSWNPPTGSTDPAVGYNVYRAVVGAPFAILNSSPVSQPAWTDTTVQAGATYNYEVTSVDAYGVESTPSSVTTVSIP
jgi:hypothetical protein